jgi:hypothetical protein
LHARETKLVPQPDCRPDYSIVAAAELQVLSTFFVSVRAREGVAVLEQRTANVPTAGSSERDLIHDDTPHYRSENKAHQTELARPLRRRFVRDLASGMVSAVGGPMVGRRAVPMNVSLKRRTKYANMSEIIAFSPTRSLSR